MDIKTGQYYKEEALRSAELYSSAEKGVSIYFKRFFPAGSSVLDIGCGSGRDLKILLDMGYDPYGIDASAEMIDAALKIYPELEERISAGSIPADELFFNRKFQCIICSAVLMHITDELINDAALSIKKNLNPGGRLLVSVPLERDDINSDGRSSDGRLFIIRRGEYYRKLFEEHDLILTEEMINNDSLGRRGVTWLTAFYQLMD
jgi:SAM-dependent methyltransferase